LKDFNDISIAATGSDLRLYVMAEMKTRSILNKLDSVLKQHIVDTLLNKADGMYQLSLCLVIRRFKLIYDRFRWVACQLDYLCECSTNSDRRKALHKLPPDIPSYLRILERVNTSIVENRILGSKTLHWLAYSYTPLTTTQLLQALAVTFHDDCFDSDAMPTEEMLLHWCSSLVRRNRRGTGPELVSVKIIYFLLSCTA
jgi:hypothetical protein